MFIRDCIIKAAKEVISHHKVANNSPQRLSKPIIQLQLAIKKVNRIYYSFKASNIKSLKWPSNSQ